MDTTILESHLSAAASERRIREVTEVDGFLSDFVFTKGILHRSTAHGLRLRVRNPSRRSAFSPRCFLKFRSVAGGTRIEIRATTALYPVIFMFVWLGGVVVIGTPMVIVSALTLFGAKTSVYFTGSPIAGILVPLALLSFGIVNVQLGRRWARVEKAEIMSLVARELGASGSPDTSKLDR
jgi:hypothetical protein